MMAQQDVNDHGIDTSGLSPNFKTLHPLVMHELLWALKVQDKPLARALLKRVLDLPARKFTRLLLELEQAVAEQGPAYGARKLSRYFFDDLTVIGGEHIPQEGACIIAANHPGGMDFVAQIEAARRDDLLAITSDVNFLRPLPAVSQYLVPISSDTHGRYAALRETLAHLRGGGCLLLYPTGSIDPDPHYFRNAEDHLARWSRSLAVYLQKGTPLQVVPAITSQAISEKILFSRLVMHQKRRVDRQRAAEFLQTMNMMYFKGQRLNLKVSFGEALVFDDPHPDEAKLADWLAQIKQAAQILLQEHLIRFPPARTELWEEKEQVFQSI
jgi:1-acyl-sn-glycerol-3-phosphate acyltransferase